MGAARLNISDGSLNREFDGDGLVTLDFYGKQDGAQVIEPRLTLGSRNESHVLLGGYLTLPTKDTSDFALAGFTYQGKLTESFFDEANEKVEFKLGRNLIFDLIDQPDGDIIATGWAGDGANFDLGIAKWDGNGRLDSGWGLQGEYTLDTSSGANNVAFDAMLYEDTIITAGTGLNPATGNDDFILTQHENEKFAEIIKRAPTTPVVRGDIITYTFEIKNLTDNELPLIITDVLPVGVTFEESQNPDWSILSEFGKSPIIERQLSVSGGQTLFIGLRVRADQSGILKNKANLLLPHPNDPVIGYITPTFLSSSEVESEVKEPEITSVTQNGKKLIVTGLFGSSSGANQSNAIGANTIEPQASCPVILIDGQEQKTKRDSDNPSTVLIAKKGGKKIARGQTVTIKVRLCDGTETADFTFTRPQ